MSGRSVEEQERIGKEMERLGMRMGVFVGAPGVAFGNNGLASGRKDTREQFLSEIKNALEVQKRVNAKWCTIVPGELDHRLEMGYQTANVVDILRRGAELCEKSGLIMVLEALNPWRDHPNMFLLQMCHIHHQSCCVGCCSHNRTVFRWQCQQALSQFDRRHNLHRFCCP